MTFENILDPAKTQETSGLTWNQTVQHCGSIPHGGGGGYFHIYVGSDHLRGSKSWISIFF